MKLRVAAILAVVVLLVSIAAFLWDGGRDPGEGGRSDSSTVEPKTVPASTGELSTSQPSRETDYVARPGDRRDVPRPATPAAGARPAGAPAERPTTAARVSMPPAPAVPPGTPANAGLPPVPPDPLVRAAAAIDADKVSLMLRDYRTRMGENPVGTNAEIMKAVMGGNPKQAKLGPPEGMQVNAEGELLDRWGTPFFFHQLSKASTEVRSAGPDRVLWTEDDVIHP